MRRGLVLFVAAAGRILAPARRFFGLALWSSGPKGQTKAALLPQGRASLRAVQHSAAACCGGPKDPKKKQLP